MRKRVVLSKFLSFMPLALLIKAVSGCATGQERAQIVQVTPQSGEWVGVRKGRDWVDATIRITSYDPTTHAFKGDGKFVNYERSASTDLVKGDGSLYGTTAYGLPSLSLKKKR